MPKIIAHKNDWIKLGYQLFSQEGIKGIIVEKMAKKLKCNKSSFYWHFKSKAEFINSLMAFWEEIETNQIINEIEKESTAPKKLNVFLKIAFQHEPYLEFTFFIKRYANKYTDIQAFIDKVDKKRLDYTTNLFQELGYSKNEAMIKANIFYKYLLGYHEVVRFKKQPKNYLKKVKEEVSHFLKV